MAVAYHWEKERRVLSGGSKVGGHRRRATATFCGLQIIYLIANEMCLMSQAANAMNANAKALRMAQRITQWRAKAVAQKHI